VSGGELSQSLGSVWVNCGALIDFSRVPPETSGITCDRIINVADMMTVLMNIFLSS